MVCLTIPSLLSLHTTHAPFPPPTKLTFNTARDYGPVIASDGLKVAFFSDLDGDFEIYMINSDGTGLRQLTINSNSNDTSPSISSNGGKVAYQSTSGNDADIWVVNSDGSPPLRLTQNNVDDTDPSISGDGFWVTFVSNDDPSCPTCNNPDGDAEIFLVKTDDTNLRQLTVNNREDGLPSISADGGKIAFQSKIAGLFEIFVVNSDGTGLTQLTNSAGGEGSSSASISSDGSKVAYESRALATESSRSMMRIRTEPHISPEIYVVNSNGAGSPVQVSATGGENYTPSISGDGNRVAYVGTGDGDTEVYVVNGDGTGQPEKVTANAVLDLDPSLDLDGDTVVYRSNLDGDFEIFAARSSGGTHDVAVTQVAVPRRIGFNSISSNPLQVNVTVANQGNVDETVTVELSFLAGPVLSAQTSLLPTASSRVLTFGVSPEFLALGTYTLVARAIPVPGETDTSDNTFVDGTVEVRIPGDVDDDLDVDIIDAATMAYAFGRICGDVRYLGASDFDNDCDVDIIDAAILAANFGATG